MNVLYVNTWLQLYTVCKKKQQVGMEGGGNHLQREKEEAVRWVGKGSRRREGEGAGDI